MNIPNHVHFGLGFGFKYQYLLSTLLHALMTGNNLLSDKNKNRACQNYMVKKLAQNPNIHANVPMFMKNIKKIFPDIESLNYRKDALILLEGEDSFFEDINLFTTHNETSKINFILSIWEKYGIEDAIALWNKHRFGRVIDTTTEDKGLGKFIEVIEGKITYFHMVNEEQNLRLFEKYKELYDML